MATLVPPPLPAGSTIGVNVVGSANLQALGEVVVEQVPERIANLARTILLSGTVVDQQEGGAIVLRTQVGEVVIRSQTPLPLDRVITLQIPPGAPPVRALVSVVLPNAPVPTTGAPIVTVPVTAPVTAPIAPPITVPVGTIPTPALPGVPAPIVPLPTAPAVPGVVTIAPAVTTAVPVINVPRPAVTAPVIGTPLLAPSAIASPALLQAVAEIPLLPGAVIPSQVLAVPQFNPAAAAEASFVATLTLPPAVEAQSQLQQTGAAALRALVPQGLAEVLARLPPGVLLPPAESERAAPVVPNAAPLPAASAPTTPAFASLPVLLTLPPGSNVTVQVISVTPPATPTASAAPVATVTPQASAVIPPAPVVAQPVTTAPAASVNNPVIPGTTTPIVPAPTPVIAQTIGSLALPLNEPQSPSFTAVVVGQTAQREPVATSPAGLFVLDNRAPLPVGTQVELSLVNVTEPPLEAEQDIIPRAPQDWPALQQALAGMAGALAGQAAISRLVRPEAPGNSILFILAALRIGNVQALTSDAVLDALRTRGQVDLLTRMNAEFQQMSQSWVRPDSTNTEWKTLLLPLMPQGQLTRLAIHTRQEREAHTHEGPTTVKRLVVELELSRLGPMLLDGYIHNKKMDMILRSQRMLRKELKDELRESYHVTMGALGWSGAIEFQTAAELWLKG